MKKKLKGLVFLALASVLTVCSLQGKAATDKTVIISDDVQFESSLADSNLDVSRQDDIGVGESVDKEWFHYSAFKGNKFYYNGKGKFYSTDVGTREQKKLMDQKVYRVSDSGKRTISNQGKDVYVYNLENNEKKLLSKGSPEDFYFASKEGNEIAHFDSKKTTISLSDVETDKTVTWDLSESFKLDKYVLNSIKKVGNSVYIPAHTKKDELGIYQLTDQKKVNTVLSFPGKGDAVAEFDFLKNNFMIFNGVYDGKSGVYLLNQKTNNVQLLVAGGKDSIGIWTPFYHVSPDESKIMFQTSVQIEDKFKSNVYMAELVDGSLKNSIRILDNTDLFSVISLAGQWSEDSKTIYLATRNKNNENGGAIAVFKVK